MSSTDKSTHKLRTERVTLELTLDVRRQHHIPAWSEILRDAWALWPTESVRVVTIETAAETAQLREQLEQVTTKRDELQTGCNRLKAQLAKKDAPYERAMRDAIKGMERMQRERDEYKDRVVALEAEVADLNIALGKQWNNAVATVVAADRAPVKKPEIVDVGCGLSVSFGEKRDLTTERVTLELTGRFDCPPAEWPWAAIFNHDVRVTLEPGDSVRVVAEDRPSVMDEDGDLVNISWPELADLLKSELATAKDERDAAIREREAALARVAYLEEQAARVDAAVRATAEKFVNGHNALKARVEKLEKQHVDAEMLRHAFAKSEIERLKAIRERDGELPTLGECIERQKKTARPCGGTDPAPLGGDPSGAGNGMRTERITLEVTYDQKTQGHPGTWDWSTMVLNDGESVRVVEEAVGSVDDRAYADSMACDEERDFANRILAERDAAIREREKAVAQAAEDARAYAAESDARAQAQRELQDRCDTAFVPAESACSGAAERLHRETWLRLERDELIIQRDELISRVAELEAQAKLAPDANDDGASNHAAQAASGGGEPVAWMVEWTDHAELYGSKTQAERAAAGDVVPQPLYCSPPQPRGWLTEHERRMLANALSTCRVEAKHSYRSGDERAADGYADEALAIESILARSTPPEVVLESWREAAGDVVSLDDVRAALAAIGVEVKEVRRV
jgi:hypothetical protein